MKINAKAFPFALAFAAQTSARSFLKLTLTRANLAPVSVPRRSEGFVEQKTNSAASASRTVERPSIYAVACCNCNRFASAAGSLSLVAQN